MPSTPRSRRAWPPAALKTTDLLRLHGLGPALKDPPLELFATTGDYGCPACGQPLVAARLDGFAALACHRRDCLWAADLFAAPVRAHPDLPAEPAARLDALSALGIKVPRACRGADALECYQHYLERRKAAAALARLAAARRVEASSGAVGTALGFGPGRAAAHDDPNWWELAAGELAGAAPPYWVRGLGGGGAVVTAIPAYAPGDSVPVGVWAAGRLDSHLGPAWAYRHFYARAPGLGFWSTCTLYGPAGWGGACLVVFDPTLALRLQAAARRDLGRNVPVVLANPTAWAATGAPGQALRYVGPGRVVVWLPEGRPAAGWALARRLGARVTTALPPANLRAGGTGLPVASAPGETELGYAGRVIGGARDWREVLGEAVAHASPMGRASLLEAVGYDNALGASLAGTGAWPKSTVELCRVALAAVGARAPAVWVRAGLSVEVTPQGWVHAQSGRLLLDCVPVVTAAATDARGRVVHTGTVVTPDGGRIPFKSRNFRQHAAALVERVVLARGRPHPVVAAAIGPHVGAVALELFNTNTSRGPVL